MIYIENALKFIGNRYCESDDVVMAVVNELIQYDAKDIAETVRDIQYKISVLEDARENIDAQIKELEDAKDIAGEITAAIREQQGGAA